MIYFTDQFAKVWSIDKSKSVPRGRISTSEKNQQGEWVNSSWFVSFIGKSKEKALELNGDERIKMLKGKVTSTSKKLDDDTYRNYINVTVFDFELMGQPSYQDPDDRGSVEDDELPF